MAAFFHSIEMLVVQIFNAALTEVVLPKTFVIKHVQSTALPIRHNIATNLYAMTGYGKTTLLKVIPLDVIVVSDEI